MKPRILALDIETAPIEAYVWQLWDQNVAVNQIKTDWSILSWAAKWVGEPRIFYMDQRNSKNARNDRKIVKAMRNLLNEADIILTQNGKKFDGPKINSRIVINGLKPPSSYRHIDTRVLAKKHFGFTSNSLEYMTDKLCTKYKKLQHKKFPGFELWKECLAGNIKAWNEMEKYNKHDVLALEELYTKLQPWDNSINFSVYSETPVCPCGSEKFKKRGFFYTQKGQFQRFRCKSCGSETRSSQNLLQPSKLRIGTNR